MRLQTSRNINFQSTDQGRFWKLCLTFFLKMLVSVTSPTNSLFISIQKRVHAYIFCYKSDGLMSTPFNHSSKTSKSMAYSCKPYRQRSGDSHKKDHTWKGRYRVFFYIYILYRLVQRHFDNYIYSCFNWVQYIFVVVVVFWSHDISTIPMKFQYFVFDH